MNHLEWMRIILKAIGNNLMSLFWAMMIGGGSIIFILILDHFYLSKIVTLDAILGPILGPIFGVGSLGLLLITQVRSGFLLKRPLGQKAWQGGLIIALIYSIGLLPVGLLFGKTRDQTVESLHVYGGIQTILIYATGGLAFGLPLLVGAIAGSLVPAKREL